MTSTAQHSRGMNLPLVIWNDVAKNFEMDAYSVMEKPVVIAMSLTWVTKKYRARKNSSTQYQYSKYKGNAAVLKNKTKAKNQYSIASLLNVNSQHYEVLENQLLSVSLLTCLGKHDCVERIPSERGDGVAITKQRRQDFQSDGVMDLATALGQEEEKNSDDNATSGGSIERPNGSDAEMPLNKVEKENEAKNETKNEPIKSAEKELIQVDEEESVEPPSSQPVGYYLKHRINEKLIEGLVENHRFNDSLSAARCRKNENERPIIYAYGPLEAILRKR
ncbi:hypothetical protein Tco_0681118 [Tanacetum coccineum]|uniref:Uncharacterized protein n=1 Tax=Tanacetum coccineum TaxID=301880 RepID=A0ABQ4XMR9_9ASTR